MGEAMKSYLTELMPNLSTPLRVAPVEMQRPKVSFTYGEGFAVDTAPNYQKYQISQVTTPGWCTCQVLSPDKLALK